MRLDVAAGRHGLHGRLRPRPAHRFETARDDPFAEPAAAPAWLVLPDAVIGRERAQLVAPSHDRQQGLKIWPNFVRVILLFQLNDRQKYSLSLI